MSLDNTPSCSVTELKGMFGRAAKTVPIDEMNHAIAARGVETGALARDAEGAPETRGNDEGDDQ